MQWIIDNYQNILTAIGAIVTAASTIVALTPSTKDDELLGKLIKAVEYLSVFNKKTK